MTDRRLRVLHIVQNLNYGGMERLLFEMLRLSDRSCFENHVLALQYIGRFGQGLGEFADVSLATPMTRLSLLYPQSLVRDIAAIRPDVVQTHSAVWYKATRAARAAGVPWIVHTDHGRVHKNSWFSRRLESAAAARTDVIVAVSNTVSEQIVADVDLDPKRIAVVPNGVDADLYHPTADDGVLRAQLGLSADVPIIGSIGRLEAVKGFEVMVDAFAVLRRSWQGSAAPVLVIAGDGSERAALSQRAAATGVERDIRWLGWRDDIHVLHAGFTLFTMSSHSEGTSISLLEAMAAGLCPVVTEVGGNAAVLGETLRHRLVPPSDPLTLANAWRFALTDAASRRADACLARQRVCDEFSLNGMVRTYENLYRRELLGRGRLRPTAVSICDDA